ncbi:membrane-bound PQQ-dependent dehydrogenase, glucose/quinate/shikimate family [Devosia sp. 63-57]|uniref:membrane-bound PQQ-dependent dehydrogenase, glucose/quinate/shikimate family n=1 Tax=Devosia sp. 63-57 TaxID=1895751 RepID=UPI00086A553E|nr:membrane-bound PQQ-dependent dehydrogenase, glucose/quinate/shikimate family [Devosia sp. 63-57]ODT48250.1 MAG: glucose dehydrogenase [Pelagibacterium sp. SCN 63-126]ODU82947.1 MAG: glucose dehydrogenase [Pelagibacterium sp. SCN 63-17]OJX42038.1 MAG: pyrroloquinoline quinone-dependent dehydrogenase [Devosia sp. 63-57]
MAEARARHTTDRGPTYWWAVIVAVLLIAFGAPIAAGGLYLITLGGSWYYLPAGIGLLLTAFLLIRQDRTAIGVYLLTYIGTLAWAFWEAGFNGWAQVPRLVAPSVVLLLVLSTWPALKRGRRSFGTGTAATAVTIAGLFAAIGIANHSVESTLAQDTDAPVTEPATAPVPAPEDTQATTEDTATPPTPLDVTPINFAMPEAGADWPAYGGTHHATRYSPLSQITRDNVGDLELVWEYRTGDMPEEDERYSNQNTPLKIGNQLLLCSAMNKVISLDAQTGLERWRYDPQVPTDAIPYNATCRGLAYYASPTLESTELCAERVIMNTLDARLIAVDVATGQLCSDFGNGGIVDLEQGLGHTVPGWYAPTSPPTIVRNVAVVYSQVRDNQRRDAPSGVVRGYDTESGDMLWAWDMGRPGEKGLPPEGETYTRGTPNVWTIASGDNELGHVYLPLGNSAVDYWGGMRSEAENTYSTALVALDVTTGDVAWFYQTVHYDIWDYDLGSQGSLVDFPTENGPVPALILPTKQAMFWIFDRRTGELLVEVEERPVPQGGVEPERLSPTQPFVVDFPNLLQPDLLEKHMWGMTPLDQLWCRIQYRQAYYEGIYTPPSADRNWIQWPGYNGGSDWGGVAIDPVRNIMVANYNNTANLNRLIPREDVDAMGVRSIDQGGREDGAPSNVSPQGDTPWGIKVNAGWRVPFTDMLCTQPPYGGITAIDLTTREVLWDKPFGTARKNGPFGIPSMLPFDIGTPNNAGAVVTASGLIFIAATTDDLIRAMDIESGEVLWEAELPAGGQAGPAMYEVDGQQFLVINAGGHSFMETPIGDYFLAYALPETHAAVDAMTGEGAE